MKLHATFGENLANVAQLPVANGGCLLFTNLLFKVQIISYIVKLLILFKLHK